ncbi:uncharacterized protein LOC111365518 [Olea europaea var. sylvestris]|uniref:uncharacterized protein LOC111365518 n=1 Tax=Olea europaea var. sylvestris TaxID=158386 RepID=UPI000C1D08FC|nr:uncharacterized protein LOC111365518 [Olea europaea var. sylvestris]
MCRLIIWDKAPVVNRCAVEFVDKMLRDITDCNLPFGGKVIVLGGDFGQILPAVPKGNKKDIIKANMIYSYLWPSFVHLALVENMRANQSFTYYSFDETIEKLEQSLQEDFLNTLTPNGIPLHELKLKMNCLVMLLRNINHSEGLCNGTRLIYRKFERNVILVEITTGKYRGKQVFLPRIPFIPLKTDRTTIPFKRTQFPIRPCFAMTINKAQDQPLDFVGLYIPEPVFCHGQLYVALSRAKTSRSIKVLLKPSNENHTHNSCTKNVLYKEDALQTTEALMVDEGRLRSIF